MEATLIEATQDKLAEARFFLRHLQDEAGKVVRQEPAAFGHYLSAFVSAARSVPWVLQNEEKAKYDAWLPKWDDRLTNEERELLKFTNQRRIITLNFVVDSGAADVSLPADVVSTLLRTGTIQSSDFVGTQTYTLADGSQSLANTVFIRSLKIGDKVVENVRGSIAPANSPLLLGQSFLQRFKSWSVDNKNRQLLFEPQ
jgi:clan AA aspartic protease (TIGR02281 family)